MTIQQKLCRPEGGGTIYLKWWKGKIYNQDYMVRLSFRFDGEIKSFINKQKVEEFGTTKQFYTKC